jgi:hypothetical protein
MTIEGIIRHRDGSTEEERDSFGFGHDRTTREARASNDSIIASP